MDILKSLKKPYKKPANCLFLLSQKRSPLPKKKQLTKNNPA